MLQWLFSNWMHFLDLIGIIYLSLIYFSAMKYQFFVTSWGPRLDKVLNTLLLCMRAKQTEM